MDKILEMLGINKLDEADQEKLKTKLEAIIESKANDKVEAQKEEIKESLAEEMEVKFDAYKEDITSKFSNFLDDILEEEIVIPDTVLEWARIGEEYQPIIESFKAKLSIDEGVLDDEVKSLLNEAKREIIKLTKEKDAIIAEKLDIDINKEKLINENYLLKKCDGLTQSQKEKVFTVLEGADKEEIDKKFDILVSINEDDDKFDTKECPECGADVPKEDEECPECGHKFEKKEVKESLSQSKTLLKEENTFKSEWLKILRNGTI